MFLLIFDLFKGKMHKTEKYFIKIKIISQEWSDIV